LAEVRDQSGNRPVDRPNQMAVGLGNIVMGIPRPGIDLDEPYPFFNQFSGEQTTAAEVIGGLLIDAVGGQSLAGFPGNAQHVRNLNLHAKREFVVLHPGF